MVGALGVVFGDIGTSPIYTLQTVFNPGDPHPIPVSEDSIYGIVSLIFWSVTLIVTITYVLLAMRVDNGGEGGIMALISLIRRWSRQHPTRVTAVMIGAGVFGAALFLGDSMITPAISVLSAVEGLKVVDPGFESWIVPITAVIIVILFWAQRFGTAAVGRLFGPVMIVWFVSIALCGIGGIVGEPGILRALSPTYAIGFVAGHFELGFFALAAIVLSVTGAEALYADMGHFGRKPISIGWVFLVFPACTLSYFGQGALILRDPANASAPFFLLTPEWALLPMVLLATAATVIASQSVISGAFSMVSQAVQLGYLPRLKILHTSRSTVGQIYVPWINSLLMVVVLILVFAFQSSAALAYAFGMAVIATVTITTALLFYVAFRTWRTPRWMLAMLAVVLLSFDLLLLAANMTKLVHGAWIPLVIAITFFVVMMTWQRGRRLVMARREQMEGSLADFIAEITENRDKVNVVEGTAVFFNREGRTTPLALRANVDYNRVRHAHIVIVTVEIAMESKLPESERVRVDHLTEAEDGIVHIVVRFGYAEKPDVPAVLATLSPEQTEGPIDLEGATYFLSRVELQLGDEPGMARWRKRLFISTSQIIADAADHFFLPSARTVVLGANVEV